MTARRLPAFFGDNLEGTLDSLLSAPGAFGNIVLAATRQLRPLDGLAFALVLAGWAWIGFGYGMAGDHRPTLLALSLLPTLLWLIAGLAGGLVFHVAGIGLRSLTYWEAYLLMLLFTCFGVISLRLALSPDRGVYRPPPSGSDERTG